MSGLHNVDGRTDTYPNNPDSFYSGPASNDNWTYSFTFEVDGTYDYECTPHVNMGMVGTITVGDGGDPLECISDCDIESYLPSDEDGIAANNMQDWCPWVSNAFSIDCFDDCEDDIAMMFGELQNQCNDCSDGEGEDNFAECIQAACLFVDDNMDMMDGDASCWDDCSTDDNPELNGTVDICEGNGDGPPLCILDCEGWEDADPGSSVEAFCEFYEDASQGECLGDCDTETMEYFDSFDCGGGEGVVGDEPNSLWLVDNGGSSPTTPSPEQSSTYPSAQ